MIQEHDEPILKHLIDVKVIFLKAEPMVSLSLKSAKNKLTKKNHTQLISSDSTRQQFVNWLRLLLVCWVFEVLSILKPFFYAFRDLFFNPFFMLLGICSGVPLFPEWILFKFSAHKSLRNEVCSGRIWPVQLWGTRDLQMLGKSKVLKLFKVLTCLLYCKRYVT